MQRHQPIHPKATRMLPLRYLWWHRQQYYNTQHVDIGGASTIPTLCHMPHNDPTRPETDSLRNVRRHSTSILPGAPKISLEHQHHVAFRGLQTTSSGTGDVQYYPRVHTDDGIKSTSGTRGRTRAGPYKSGVLREGSPCEPGPPEPAHALGNVTTTVFDSRTCPPPARPASTPDCGGGRE